MIILDAFPYGLTPVSEARMSKLLAITMYPAVTRDSSVRQERLSSPSGLVNITLASLVWTAGHVSLTRTTRGYGLQDNLEYPRYATCLDKMLHQ